MSWCTSLARVTVAQGTTPKPVTLIVPYYMNQAFVRRQMGWWSTYPEHVRMHISVILVDDGSPVPATDALRGLARPCAMRIFRIGKDVRWNWIAARNIGAHHAPEGWCLFTDMDHVLPATTAEHLIYGQHDPMVLYGFSRIEHTGTVIDPHPNSWLMTRALFWRIGGYDESFSGHYGTDGEYRRRAATVAPIQILKDRLIRHEYQEDSSTTAYLRKQPEDIAVQQIIASRGKNWRPKTLSFPYEEVTCSAS